MSIIDRYITREIIKNFVIILSTVAAVYVIVEFFSVLDNFLSEEVPLTRMAAFFALKLPLFISQITPICTLLTVMVTFGLMNKNNEIVALKSSGVSVYTLMRSVFVIGTLFTILLFLLSEVIVPLTIDKANRIWLVEVKKRSLVTSKQKNIWIKGKRSIYFLSFYNQKKNMISGISLNYFDADFNLIKRIEAKTGIYKNGKWTLAGIMEQHLDKNGENLKVSFYDQKVVDVEFYPQDLNRVVKRSEEMNITELYAYLRDIESEGYDATVYRVDFHAKFAFPVICIIMCIVATGLTARQRRREGLSISIAYGLGLIFLYGALYSICLSLGYGGVLPPFFAAWISNVIFLCLGLYTLLNVQ
jgi:lipopolysaccharide export system permease protein